jgi:diphthamide synthase (EF-2-diphthine--ammonia ligase)
VDRAGEESLLHHLRFRFNWAGSFQLPEGGEAFVILALLPAMKLGLPVISDLPLQPRFVFQMTRFQEIALQWFARKDLKSVEISSPEGRTHAAQPAPGVSALFSGGVDSFHTILTHQQELTHLLYVEGFDTHLHQVGYRQLANSHMERAAVQVGIPMLKVETNARQFLDHYAGWQHTGTTVTGAIAHLFARHIGKVYFPGTHSWESLHFLSDGYLLLKQFALPDFEAVVDGMSVTRQEKVAALSQCPAALEHLRVCWDTPPDKLNCGVCEKCLRTMAQLNAEGLLQKCASLPHAIDWENLESLPVRSGSVTEYWEATAARTTDPYQKQKLESMVRSLEATEGAQALWAAGKDLTTAETWPVLARKLGKPALATSWTSDQAWYLKKCRKWLPRLRGALAPLLRKHSGKVLRKLLGRSPAPIAQGTSNSPKP